MTMTYDPRTAANSALLADYVAQVQIDTDAGLLDPSPTTDAMYAEIMRRMNAGHPATIKSVHVPTPSAKQDALVKQLRASRDRIAKRAGQ